MERRSGTDGPGRTRRGDRLRTSNPGRRSSVAAGGFRIGGLAELMPGGRLADGPLLAIAAISHLAFFILTWRSLDALLAGQQAVAWMALLTVLTGLVLWVDWLLGTRLATRPAGGFAWVLAWIYVGLHGFLTLMLFLMWGFSLLGVMLSLPFADPPTRIDLPFAPPS